MTKVVVGRLNRTATLDTATVPRLAILAFG